MLQIIAGNPQGFADLILMGMLYELAFMDDVDDDK